MDQRLAKIHIWHRKHRLHIVQEAATTHKTRPWHKRSGKGAIKHLCCCCVCFHHTTVPPPAVRYSTLRTRSRSSMSLCLNVRTVLRDRLMPVCTFSSTPCVGRKKKKTHGVCGSCVMSEGHVIVDVSSVSPIPRKNCSRRNTRYIGCSRCGVTVRGFWDVVKWYFVSRKLRHTTRIPCAGCLSVVVRGRVVTRYNPCCGVPRRYSSSTNVP